MEIVEIEPDILNIDSFSIPDFKFNESFDNDDIVFKDSNYRLGIHIHRQSYERLLLASTLLKGYTPNSIFISLAHLDHEGVIDMFNPPAFALLLHHKEKYIKDIDRFFVK